MNLPVVGFCPFQDMYHQVCTYSPGKFPILFPLVLCSFDSIHTYIYGQIVDCTSRPSSHSQVGPSMRRIESFCGRILTVPIPVSLSVYSLGIFTVFLCLCFSNSLSYKDIMSSSNEKVKGLGKIWAKISNKEDIYQRYPNGIFFICSVCGEVNMRRQFDSGRWFDHKGGQLNNQKKNNAISEKSWIDKAVKA